MELSQSLLVRAGLDLSQRAGIFYNAADHSLEYFQVPGTMI